MGQNTKHTQTQKSKLNFFAKVGSSSAKTVSMKRNSGHWLERSTQVSSNWFFLMGLQVGSCYNWTQELLFSQRMSYAIRPFETHCSPLTQNSIIEKFLWYGEAMLHRNQEIWLAWKFTWFLYQMKLLCFSWSILASLGQSFLEHRI